MELRDSGRGLVQIKDDGTHAILPVTSGTNVQPDHARVPVMLLRHFDGKMRRDGSRAALLQPDHPVDERGRLHGAPGLAVVDEPRVLARIRGPCRRRERKREWVRAERRHDRLRGQDKANWRSLAPTVAKACLHIGFCTLRRRLMARWRGAALRTFLFDFNPSSDGARNVRG